MLDGLLTRGMNGKRILLPRAEVARSTLPDGLRQAGAHVDVVPVYQTRRPEHVDPRALHDLMSGRIDIITFTSPSTVHNLLELTGGTLSEGTVIACIGPVTAAAVSEAGLRADLVAQTYSIPGLVDALIQWRKKHD